MSLNICPPAKFYFILSFISLIIMIYQNFGNKKLYCLGIFGCYVENTIYIFILKLMYILFWTWLLNLICKNGGEPYSWILVLFPFILFFILIIMALFS